MTDAGTFLDAVEARLVAARRGGGYARADASDPDLYGTAAAAGIRTALGSPLDGDEARAAAAVIRSFRRPDGAFADPTHGPMHRTATATATLRLLGDADSPPAFLAARFRPDAVDGFLDGLDWDAPWPASHEFAGLLAIAVATGLVGPGRPEGAAQLAGSASPDGPAWLDAYLGWFDRNVDPATGLWRRGRVGAVDVFPGRFGNLAGAFHLHFLLEALGRDWPHSERVVDTGLVLFAAVRELRPDPADGLEPWGFPHLDWAYSTGRAAARSGHRLDEVRAALAELAAGAAAAFADPAAADGDLHVVQARVALVAEFAHQGIAVETGGRRLTAITDARPFI